MEMNISWEIAPFLVTFLSALASIQEFYAEMNNLTGGIFFACIYLVEHLMPSLFCQEGVASRTCGPWTIYLVHQQIKQNE